MIQNNSYGGVQKLAETRAVYFVLGSGSAILTDFGPKVVTLCIFFDELLKRDILGRRSIKKGVPKREKMKKFFIFHFFIKNTALNAK